MTTSEIARLLGMGPVVPVIVIEDVAHAVPLARALVAGGVRALEITLADRARRSNRCALSATRCPRRSSGRERC